MNHSSEPPKSHEGQPSKTEAESTAKPLNPSASVSETSIPNTDSPVVSAKPESAGCFPAVLAATVLMGIVLFITFGFAGYLIFQKRGDLAARTIRGTIISELEQSRLEPATKQQVIERLLTLADDIESKKLENWQAGGVMNRIIRSPLLRWGDLQAIDAWAATNLPQSEYAEFHKQITRFFRAAELDRAIASDLQDILLPVTSGDPREMLGRLKTDLVDNEVREVAVRARIVADRAEVPDQVFEDVSLPRMIERLIELGAREGTT